MLLLLLLQLKITMLLLLLLQLKITMLLLLLLQVKITMYTLDIDRVVKSLSAVVRLVQGKLFNFFFANFSTNKHFVCISALRSGVKSSSGS